MNFQYIKNFIINIKVPNIKINMKSVRTDDRKQNARQYIIENDKNYCMQK